MPAELAPSPPDVEVCSCDEALALRAEVAQLRESIARMRKILAEGHPVGSPEARLANDLREVLGDG